MRRLFTSFPLLVLLGLAAPAAAADDTFAIAKTDAKGVVGTPATASVTITSKQGWHLNHEAPFTLKLAPAPGVTVPKPKLVRADLAMSSDTEARFDVPVTVAEPGQKAIEAEAGFVLCQKEACRPIKEKLTLSAEGTVAAPPAPAKKTKKR